MVASRSLALPSIVLSARSISFALLHVHVLIVARVWCTFELIFIASIHLLSTLKLEDGRLGGGVIAPAMPVGITTVMVHGRHDIAAWGATATLVVSVAAVDARLVCGGLPAVITVDVEVVIPGTGAYDSVSS